MPTAIETIIQPYLKTDLPDIQPGDTVRVHQKVKEAPSSPQKGTGQAGSGQAKERIQVFEGVVLAKKHGTGISGTITVRKVSQGVAVERIFPIHAPFIQKIEVVKRAKVRRAKLYYLREAKGKKARLKAKKLGIEVVAPEPEPAAQEPQKAEETNAAAEPETPQEDKKE